MSQLAALTQEVEDVLAQIDRLERPAQHARDVIRGVLAAAAAAERDPRTRREVMVHHDHLERADRALREALATSARSAATGRRWLAEHAATGGVGGGAGGAAAQLAFSGGASSSLSSGGVVGLFSALSDQLGATCLDGYVFGLSAAVVTGAFSPALGANAADLVAAVASCSTPAFFEAGAAAGLAFLLKLAIKPVAGAGAHVKDAGSYSSIGGQLWRVLCIRSTHWTPTEWGAALAAAEGTPAIAAVLTTAHAPLLVIAAASALASGAGWVGLAAAHHRARRRPDMAC